MVAFPLAVVLGWSVLCEADGIIDIPQDSEGYEAGELVNVHLKHSPQEIARTLVITGSHDPLLDEAADIMRRTWRDASWHLRMWAVWAGSWRSNVEKRNWAAFIS
jgi:putative molybdopterin biosynthesis protein